MSARRLSPRRVDDARAFGRVAVLLGGTSAERDISLLTGQAVLEALRRRGVDAHGVDARGDVVGALRDGGYTRVWIALHGRGGEDGTMQGLLEVLGLPYTGSGVLGSALAMDKLRSKQIFAAAGLATPRWAMLGRDGDGDGDGDVDAVLREVGLPLVVKPACEGSSIGMTRVDTHGEMAGACETAFRYDDAALVEAWIDGDEYTAAVLAGEVLPLIRIETPRTFYDYEAKYFSDTTRYHCPCGLPGELERAHGHAALAAFRALGAAGWGRVDFMVGADGRASMLEVNTVPGMTDHSLVPMAAAQAGVDFDELVWRILETSLGREGEGR